MSKVKFLRSFVVLALSIGLGSFSVKAQEIKKVFVIAMENHNWTQPANQFTGTIQQIYQNPNAPFINNLVNGTAFAIVGGKVINISEQTAYATAYHNVLATPTGSNPHIHPSEPNYIWAEGGDNFGVFNDDDPFADNPPNNQATTDHLVTLLANAGKTWKSYQEDIDLTPDGTSFQNVLLPQDQWTVPLTSHSGVYTSGVNQFNGSNQFNYAAKHNPVVFFSDTSGGNDATPTNPLTRHYAPLQQLFTDLQNNTVADYNWISPNQHNDMHTTLTAGYKGLTGDPAKIRQGDDFLSKIVPMIMASEAYKDHGAIILWWDESEGDGVSGDNPDNFDHTVPEIIISPRAHKNVDGRPYASPINFTHSSDVRTMQEIFHVGPFIRDAENVPDLSDLFAPGAVPRKP